MQYWQPSWKNLPEDWWTSLIVREGKKRKFSTGKKVKFSSKPSYGYADCSFEYHVQKIFGREPRKFRSLSKGNDLSKTVQQRSFSSNYCYAHVECSFDIRARTVLTKSNFFTSMCDNDKKLYFFSKKTVFP